MTTPIAERLPAANANCSGDVVSRIQASKPSAAVQRLKLEAKNANERFIVP
jgi:hypothetical protein